MQSQFDITTFTPSTDKTQNPSNDESTELLRELVNLQKQILAQLQSQAAAQDAASRWRSLLERWSQDFPGLPNACRQALPILEHAYGSIVSGLVDELGQNGEDALDNDFTLQEFLDRYGIRVGQLGNILNLVGPLAEASTRKGPS